MSKLKSNDIQSMLDEDYFDEKQTNFQKRVKHTSEDQTDTGNRKKVLQTSKFLKPLHKQYPESK